MGSRSRLADSPTDRGTKAGCKKYMNYIEFHLAKSKVFRWFTLCTPASSNRLSQKFTSDENHACSGTFRSSKAFEASECPGGGGGGYMPCSGAGCLGHGRKVATRMPEPMVSQGYKTYKKTAVKFASSRFLLQVYPPSERGNDREVGFSKSFRKGRMWTRLCQGMPMSMSARVALPLCSFVLASGRCLWGFLL